jgi:hypothetical protein
VRRPRQAQPPQPSPPGPHRRRPRRSAPPKRRVSARSWGRIARRLDLGERVLRRLGCFGARESHHPCPARARLAAIGKAVLSRPAASSSAAGRKEPPNPIPETHNEHLRRQTLEPCRPCAATTPRATPPACGRRVLDPRISSPRRSERCSFARGLPARRSSSAALTSSGRVHATVWGSSSTGTSSRPWKGGNPALGARQQGKRTAVTHTRWTALTVELALQQPVVAESRPTSDYRRQCSAIRVRPRRSAGSRVR